MAARGECTQHSGGEKEGCFPGRHPGPPPARFPSDETCNEMKKSVASRTVGCVFGICVIRLHRRGHLARQCTKVIRLVLAKSFAPQSTLVSVRAHLQGRL